MVDRVHSVGYGTRGASAPEVDGPLVRPYMLTGARPPAFVVPTAGRPLCQDCPCRAAGMPR